MGYFSNGIEGAAYEDEWCSRCYHMRKRSKDDLYPCCPIFDAHNQYNYDECNNERSILHKMIPREGVRNGECIFFDETDDNDDRMPPIPPPARRSQMKDGEWLREVQNALGEWEPVKEEEPADATD